MTPPAGALPPPGWYAMPDGSTAWWDGGQWVQAPPAAPVEAYRSIDGLTSASVALLALAGLVSLLVAIAEINRYQLMNKLIDRPGSVDLDTLEAADGFAAAVSIIDVLLLLATGIVFLVWLNRVFKNLRGPLRAGRLEYTPGWAVGWWFVPFANFVKPKQVMNEAWKASEPGSSDPSIAPAHWNSRKPPSLFSWWWGAWISAGLVSRFAVSWGSSNDTLSPSAESLRTQFMWSAIGSVLYVIAAVLAVVVVRSIAERHQRRAQNLGLRGGWGG